MMVILDDWVIVRNYFVTGQAVPPRRLGQGILLLVLLELRKYFEPP
jgi:hypothetical protein